MQADSVASESNSPSIACYFDDSDAEDDELLYDGADASHTPWTDEPPPFPINSTDNPANSSGLEPFLSSTSIFSGDTSQVPRNVRPKLVHPSSPRSNHQNTRPESSSTIPGPQKLRVVIKDVAYTTYRAVLYYVGLPSLSCASRSHLWAHFSSIQTRSCSHLSPPPSMMCPNHVNLHQSLPQVPVHVENGWLNGQRVILGVHSRARPKLHTGWLMERLRSPL
jgi:hypothetical protein